MLILARKSGEKIKIGNDIVLNVLEVEGGTVKLGIEAPKDIEILRMEVYEKIQNENIRSVSGGMEKIEEALDLIKNKFTGKE